MNRLCWLFLIMMATLQGCVVTTPSDTIVANDPMFAPVVPEVPREKIIEDGAIFRPYLASSLFSDVRARQIGDIITVRLAENTNAIKIARNQTLKETDVSIDPVIGLNGAPVSVGGNSLQVGVGSANQFLGDARANQSNQLTGNISVTVVDVLPNQNLVIRGEKWLTLNGGDEYIRLTGIIRPTDVSPENEVSSTKVANARIQYSGKGSFAGMSTPGWLSRFFSSDWWPM